MYTLTITYGDYGDGLRTLVHRSERSHGWEYQGDGYWQFWTVAEDGSRSGNDWDAIVTDVRSAVDVKQVEPATAQGEGEGVDPVSGWVQDGVKLTAQVPPIGPWETGH